MSYRYKDITDTAKEIRKKLKVEFPDCKFSVTIERFSMGQSLCVALMSSPNSPFQDNLVHHSHNFDYETEPSPNPNYAQLNQYQLRDDYQDSYICNGRKLTPDAWNLLKRVDAISNIDNWDNSDMQTDYSDVNYYFDIHIGKWNKPFTIN